MAIIAILSSLLLPALITAKDKAKLVLCLGNIKQNYLGLVQYVSDCNDQLPEASWETCQFNKTVASPKCLPVGLALLRTTGYSQPTQFFCPASWARPSGPNWGFNSGEEARSAFLRNFNYYAYWWPNGPKYDYVLSYNRYSGSRTYPAWQCNTLTQLHDLKLWTADGYTTQWSRPYHLIVHKRFQTISLGWTDGGATVDKNWLPLFNPSASWWAIGVNELPNHTFWDVMKKRR